MARLWMASIGGLLLMNLCIVAVTLACATRDRSFAVKPGYYQKAVEWDRAARDRDRGTALGWDTTVTPVESKGELALRVTLRGSSSPDAPALDGAQLHVEAFGQARSGERLAFYAHGVGNGVYEAPAAVTRPGLWETSDAARTEEANG